MPRFSPEEIVEIWERLGAGQSVRSVAITLGRYLSAVRQLISRSSGDYPGLRAERSAAVRARRPKSAKLATNPMLRAEVEAKLKLRWSPQQISAWLATAYPDNKEMG